MESLEVMQMSTVRKSIEWYEREITRAYLRGDNEEAHRIEKELYGLYPKWAIGDTPDDEE